MNAVLTATLPLVGVLIGATTQYVYGNRLEVRKHLTQQKAQAHSDFFKAMAVLAQNQSSEMNALAADAKTRICIYGSGSVIEKLGLFHVVGATVSLVEGPSALVELVKTMRSDLVTGKTISSDDEISQILFGKQ